MIYNMYSTPDKQQSIISNEPETEKASGIIDEDAPEAEPETEKASGIIDEDAPEAEPEKPKKTTKKKG